MTHVVIDDGERFLSQIHQVIRHVGDVRDIIAKLGIGVNERQHGFAVRAAFEFKDTAYGSRIGGITPNSPDGIRWIKDYSAFTHHLHGTLDIFNILFHQNSLVKWNLICLKSIWAICST